MVTTADQSTILKSATGIHDHTVEDIIGPTTAMVSLTITGISANTEDRLAIQIDSSGMENPNLGDFTDATKL